MTEPATAATPELDKRSDIMHSLRHPHEVLTDFLDWLRDDQGLRLCKFEEREVEEPCPGFGMFETSRECRNGIVWEYHYRKPVWRDTGEPHAKCNGTGWVTVPREDWWEDTRRPETLFADFFGLDEDKIEAERRAMLDSLRAGG